MWYTGLTGSAENVGANIRGFSRTSQEVYFCRKCLIASIVIGLRVGLYLRFRRLNNYSYRKKKFVQIAGNFPPLANYQISRKREKNKKKLIRENPQRNFLPLLKHQTKTFNFTQIYIGWSIENYEKTLLYYCCWIWWLTAYYEDSNSCRQMVWGNILTISAEKKGHEINHSVLALRNSELNKSTIIIIHTYNDSCWRPWRYLVPGLWAWFLGSTRQHHVAPGGYI